MSAATVLRKIFRGPSGQRIGHLTDRAGRYLLDRVLDQLLPVPPNITLDALTAVRRVLLVRPNFRIGNMLLTTPLVLAVRERFPDADLEVLVGDTTVSLLGGLPIDAIHCVSRFHVLFPWRFVALFRRLRRSRFDVAIAASTGSFSGGFYTFLSGARYRIGSAGRADRFLNVRLSRPRVAHAYDSAPAFARSLGVSCPDRPVYRVSPAEDAEAVRILSGLGLANNGTVRPFLAMFVGGHLRKRSPRSFWIAVARELERLGITFAILLGPEEVTFASRLRADLLPSARIVSPHPLRIFAALLAKAHLLVTPDSGAMHLAAALGVPTIALIQSKKSEFYRTAGADDQALVEPTVEMVVAAVTAFRGSGDLSARGCAGR
jgi:heptosyltransferase-3